MGFGSELKPNEFGAINGYVERQLGIYSGLSRLLAEKAAAEKEYGRRLLELSRGFQEQLAAAFEAKEGAAAGSLALTDGEAAGDGPLALLPAAHEWALRLEEDGRLHVQLASKVGSDVADGLHAALDALDGARRRGLEFYQRLLAERDRVYERKDKARAQYEARSKALGSSQQRQERATTEKDQDKYRQKSDREAAARNQAKNEYVLQVAVANEVKRAVNHTFTPRAMDAMHEIDCQRAAVVRRLLVQMLRMQDAADTRRADGSRRAAHVVARVVPDADAAEYVRRRAAAGVSRWDEPPDFRVVVDVAAGEDDAMALDGESQAILRNLCVQAQRDGARAEHDARTAAQTAAQARREQQEQQQQQEPAEKPPKADADRVLELEREATLAELELVQHQALRAAVEQQLGPVDQGTPHDFRAHTVAIAKTCDYCGESIGGLNRKAARCAQCDYTCHARCQIKVEPTCPGPDPDARGGFLSLFGSKRGGRRKSQRHQRTASAASGDSQASRDSSLPQRRAGTGAGAVARSRSNSHSSSMGAAQRPVLAPPPPSMTPLPAMPQPIAQQPGPYGVAMGAARPAAPAGHDSPAPALAAASAADGAVPVLYDFDGDGAATLSVRAGDRVRIVAPDADGSGWTEVAAVGAGGRQGMVPTSYVDMSQYRPQSLPQSRAPSSLAPPSPALAPQQRGGSHDGGDIVVALYDFAGRDADELSCAAGDRIRVVSREIGEGWLLGALAGREGRLPASYVRDDHQHSE
ncbi:Protein BZZ1 [Coemansia biformis]|uniref:Protein BZZ1 n=1 Tax=Coemansia biformis TaxID=1286918 RepID=A0A9W7YAW7_9FUNG|nr:Protein BZZ1 [Coemansia biformis]